MGRTANLALLPVDAPALRPPDRAFGPTLRQLRLHAGLSQNALAKIVGINASYVNRLESGERRQATDTVTLALARGLDLCPADTDALLLSAGYAPTWLRWLGGEDPTVRALAALLTDDALDDATLADFRAVVEAVAARFGGRVPPARTPPRRLGR